MTGDLYADRQSINPRAFAVRHLIIQEVKFRKSRVTARTDAAALDRVARGADVVYDGDARTLVVRLEGAEVTRIPLGSLALYTRGDRSSPQQAVRDDVRHWDAALEDNRHVVRDLVDALVARVAAPSA